MTPALCPRAVANPPALRTPTALFQHPIYGWSERRRLKFILLTSCLLLLLAAGCGKPAPHSADAAADLPTLAAAYENLFPVGIWQDEDPYLHGNDALAEAVADLGTNIRVLHTGAHPDDELSDLAAYLSRGRHYRTAYLSANRGEGGQNGIGPEMGAALGVIRTEELLAARRIDGAEQYFLNVPDFGFSKSAAETLKIWDEESTLKQLVHFVRWYRPHVIISEFSGTPLDGHGHHQAMGLLTRKAFDAAADPAFNDDLPPWHTQLLYQSFWKDPGEDALPGQRFSVETGMYDSLLGKTYHQIAMDGRSQHRSQDMGAAQDPGPHQVALRLWAAAASPWYQPTDLRKGDPFQDVCDGLKQINRSQERDEKAVVVPLTPEASRVLDAEIAAQKALAEGDPTKLLEALFFGHGAALAGAQSIQQWRARSNHASPASDTYVTELTADYLDAAQRFERAMHLASGVLFDVRCSQRFLTPGQTGTLTVRMIWQDRRYASGAPTVQFDHAAEWKIEEIDHDVPNPAIEAPSTADPFTATWHFRFTVPLDQPYTQPQYEPMAWAKASVYGNRNQATMDLPPIVAHLNYQLPTYWNDEGGSHRRFSQPITVATAAQYVWTDPRFGERRETVKVRPPVSVEMSPPVLLVQNGFTRLQSIPAQVKVTSLVDHPLTVQIQVERRPGQTVKSLAPLIFEPPVTLPRAGLSYVLPIPDMDVENGDLPVQLATAGVLFADSPDRLPVAPQQFALKTETRIDYPHIRPHNLYQRAEMQVLHLDAKLPANLKVAYLSGPGTDDDLIDALKQFGAAVTLLDEAALAKATAADLAAFDTIFAGVRSYEVRADLPAQNPRLLDYVKAGGTLVVLYQKYPFAKQSCAPAAFNYAVPHDRVTEEDSTVTILKPEHLLFTTPNKITVKDFDGWHQDRGLYFFAEAGRDAGYEALLSCHDAGEPAKTGGLLDYKLGQGHWLYCAYALHLQIPQAVPGAWRMLANFASYGRVVKQENAAPAQPAEPAPHE